MKINYIISLCFLSFTISAQRITVPSRIDFAGMSIQLDRDAQSLIYQDVNALMLNRQYWNAKLDRVIMYFPVIESVLVDEDVPTDFKYLAVQESSLTPDAVSSSNAVGYWQFKRETALDYGMRVDNDIDERKSITASTRGAARYLKRSNVQFNNWVSSLYSYYLGVGGISKLIPADWAYAKEIFLDGNTDRYVLRFLAHKIAIETALQTYQPSTTLSLVEYPNGGGKTFRQIAGEMGVTEADIRNYNRWVTADGIPTDKEYVLVIPVAKAQVGDARQRISTVVKPAPNFVQDDVGFPVLKKITTGVRSADEAILYEINGLPGIQAQAGDNAESLARKAKISYSSFLRYNDMTDTDPVTSGDVYYLAKKRKKALVPFHTVRPDETLRSVSQRYALRLKKLLKYNRIDRGVQKLVVGRVLWLRERRPAKTPVEVINLPPASPAPIYTPAPVNQPITEIANQDPDERTTNTDPARTTNQIPRNASERKLYQPKLVPPVSTDPGATNPYSRTTPSQTQTQPTTGGRSTTPMRQAPAPGDPVLTQTTPPTTSDPTERTIIIRSEGEPTVTRTTPPTTRPAPTNSVPTRSAPTRQPTPVTTFPLEEEPAPTRTASTPTRTAPPVFRPSTSASSTPTEQPVRQETNRVIPTTPTPATTRPNPIETEVAATTRPVTRPPVTTKSTTDNRAMTHSVEAGQTYYSISKQYGVSVESILAANNLTAEDRLAVGQKLTIANVPAGFPVGQPIRTGVNTSGSTTTTVPQPTVTYHTVAKGETMYRISKLYNVTIEQIQEWNQLSDLGVKEGQRIKILKDQ